MSVHACLKVSFRAADRLGLRKFAGNSLPPVMHTDGSNQRVSVDASAVLQTIREEAARIPS